MSVRQELKKRRTWLIGKGDGENQAADQLLELRSRPDGDDTAHAVAGIVAGLASFVGVRGELALADGGADGWTDVQRSIQLWMLRIDVEHALYARGAPALRAMGVEAVAAVTALCTCYAIALRRSDDEARLRDRMTVMHHDTRMVRPKWWTDHSVAAFGSRLLGLGVAGNVKPPHRDVLAHGNDDRQLARSLAAACDYHAEHMTIGNQGHEFGDGPFGLIPVEVLAVLALRKRADKLMPTVGHELLAGGVATWSDVDLTTVDDPLRAALAARALPAAG